MRKTFSDTRANGDHVDYFRDDHARCIAIVNARLVMPDGVVAKPTPTFDRVEIDGKVAQGFEPQVMGFLYAQKWEQQPDVMRIGR